MSQREGMVKVVLNGEMHYMSGVTTIFILRQKIQKVFPQVSENFFVSYQKDAENMQPVITDSDLADVRSQSAQKNQRLKLTIKEEQIAAASTNQLTLTPFLEGDHDSQRETSSRTSEEPTLLVPRNEVPLVGTAGVGHFFQNIYNFIDRNLQNIFELTNGEGGSQ
eukprot:TRINITY_DN8384_c0_g1_i2.p1 TRINITY_DN8384_c0_g1~~TRINITY_DN8384_c0_g1_i2.p1  ORF type:complete len:165 (-),score=28.11 TRINITY_DN8384_c0_g1_i2:114-608(-)